MLLARTARRCLLLALLAALSGCATHGDVFREVEGRLAVQQPQQALAALEPLGRFGRDRSLYQLNRAMLLRMQDDYAASAAAFEQAKALGLALDASSLTEGLGALTLSEGVRSYVPDLYERLLLHVYQALNFLEQGDLDAARVEALQIDLALRRLDPADARAKHGGDAFARYLTGLIYEARSEWSDALIAYRLAARAYQAQGQSLPLSLRASLLALSEHQGLHDEHAALRERYPDQVWQPVARGQGEVVLVLSAGLRPRLYARSVMGQNFSTGQLYRVSLPALQRRPPRVAALRLEAGDQVAVGETVEAVHRLAEQALDAKLPGLTARAIARNVVKHNGARQAREENPLLGFIVNIAGALSEQADTRSWMALPDTIHLVRLSLPPGEHTLSLVLEDAAGGTVATRTYAVALAATDKRFISLHWTQ